MLNFTIQLTAFNSTTLKEEKINSQSENCRNWWNSLQSGDLFLAIIYSLTSTVYILGQ